MQSLVIKNNKKAVPHSWRNRTDFFSTWNDDCFDNIVDETGISSDSDYITEGQYLFLIMSLPVSIILVIDAAVRWIQLIQMLS